MLYDTPLIFSYEFCLTALVAGLQNSDCRIVTITAIEPPAISGLRGVESHSPEEQLVLSGRVCSADRVMIEWISPAGVAGEWHRTSAKSRGAFKKSLQWRQNGHDVVSNHQPHNLFTQPLQIKENIKALHHWPLCGEFTGDWWIPRTNGQ